MSDRPRQLRPAPLLVLSALVLLAFAVSLWGGFVVDDKVLVLRNSYLLEAGQWPRFFTEGVKSGAGLKSTLYRPLTLVSYKLNHLAGGLSAWGYHAANILLHLVAALLVFALARKLELSDGAALVGAALFAVHPLQAEAVASVTGRADLLAAVGVLGGLLCHISARRRRAQGRPSAGWLAAAVALYGAALLSKEHAIVLPAVALVYDWRWGDLRRSAGSLAVYAGYAVVGGAYLAVRYTVFQGALLIPSIHPMDNPLAPAAWPERVTSALWVAGRYLSHLVFPFGLSSDYSFAETVPFASALSPGALATLAVSALALAALMVLAWRSRRAAVGLALAGLAFLPVSNILFPIGTAMGDRLFYLPLAGVGLLAAVAWQAWGPPHRRAAVALAGLALMALTGLSALQSSHWRDEFTLYSHAVEAAPRSAKLQYNVAALYFEKKELALARAHYLEARDIYPEFADAHFGLGQVALEEEDYLEAREHLLRARELDPTSGRVQACLGLAHLKLGEAEEARRAFERSLELGPRDAKLLTYVGVGFVEMGEEARALSLWERAVEVDSYNALGYYNLGAYYELADQSEKARRYYQRFFAVAPKGDFEDLKQQLRDKL